jgi:hypothetical protein
MKTGDDDELQINVEESDRDLFEALSRRLHVATQNN